MSPFFINGFSSYPQITGAILAYSGIHLGHNSFAIQAANLPCACQERAKRCKLIKGFAPREFATSPLRVFSRPRGEVVAHCVVKDVLGGIFLSVIDYSRACI